MTDLPALVDDLLSRARRAGADDAVASAASTEGLSASMRDGTLEDIGRSETLDVGVRVLVGTQQACVSSSSAAPDALTEMCERAVAMAREAPEDPYCGLADADQLAAEWPELDLHDPSEATPDRLAAGAERIDAAMRAVPGVAKTETSGAGWRRSEVALAMSNGFRNARKGSFWNAEAVAIAGEGTGMERDYAFASSRWREDLRDLEDIGREAGERAVRRQNPRKVSTQKVPIILEQRVASSMLGHLVGAINGASVARGSTFLADRLGARIFRDGMTITDDPHRRRGIASRAVDGEGLATAPRALVEDGVLQSWILDLATARQLGLASTASASFGIGSVPRPTTSNVTMQKGSRSVEEMIGDLKTGFLVTEMIGSSINATTGDYSRGAIGYWIEDGEVAYPVTEATVVGNLLEMFAALEPATDLPLNRSFTAPSVLIEGCTVAGN